jgi:hypothetical protein
MIPPAPVPLSTSPPSLQSNPLITPRNPSTSLRPKSSRDKQISKANQSEIKGKENESKRISHLIIYYMRKAVKCMQKYFPSPLVSLLFLLFVLCLGKSSEKRECNLLEMFLPFACVYMPPHPAFCRYFPIFYVLRASSSPLPFSSRAKTSKQMFTIL